MKFQVLGQKTISFMNQDCYDINIPFFRSKHVEIEKFYFGFSNIVGTFQLI